MRYSIEPEDRIYVNRYGFLSFDFFCLKQKVWSKTS